MANRELKVIWGSVVLAAALAASAFFAPTTSITKTAPTPKPSPTKTAAPVDPTALTDVSQIFDVSRISDVHLDIPAASKKLLHNANYDKFVPATFQFTQGDKKSPVMQVCIKIKGTTSRYSIDTTYRYTSFRVKFACDTNHAKQTLLGLKSFALNAMTQDSSKIHEVFAYDTYRAMGIAAPRTGYTHLTLSKNVTHPDRGLYVIVEAIDDVFLGENFQDVTQHLYESNHNFTEITPTTVGKDVETDYHFKVKEGWKATPNRADLRAFAKGIQASGKKFWDFLETNTNRDQLVMHFATDNFTGGWDTYSGPLKNNFFIRSDLAGKFTFIPWGVDNTWGENYFNDIPSKSWFKEYVAPIAYHDDFFFNVDATATAFPGSFFIAHDSGVKDPSKWTNYQLSRGQLFTKCLNYKPCATLYFQDLQKLSDWATQTNLAKRMLDQGNVISKLTSDFSKAELKRTSAWVAKQQANVKKAIAKHCDSQIQNCN